MYIWLINHYAVPPQYYPLARQTYFANNLMKMGHRVTIISASTVHNSDINLITDGSEWRRETVDGVDHVYIKCCDYKDNGIKRVCNMCEFAWKLPGVCKHLEKPDAIVSTSMPPMSCAKGVKIAKKYGVPAIAEIADLWPESIVEYGIASQNNPAVIYLRKLEKWIYINADSLIFTGAGGYESIVANGWEKEVPREKFVYINNGIDLEYFDYNKEHFIIEDSDLDDESKLNVVYTGSIRKVNDLSGILEVAKNIKNPKINFLIWGNGDQLESLKKRVMDEKISNVNFKGGVEKKYIANITSKAFINYAHNQPSPLFKYGISFNKIFDYLAAGRPILCDFPCSYNPVIMGNAGVSVDSANPKEIACQIEAFADMPKKEFEQYCINARKTAEEYDFSILTQKLVDVINKIRE